MVFGGRQFPPKNERKQVDLRYHSSKVVFVRSFFGGNRWRKKTISKLTALSDLIFFFKFLAFSLDSQSKRKFFLAVRQNNFGNKIPFLVWKGVVRKFGRKKMLTQEFLIFWCSIKIGIWAHWANTPCNLCEPYIQCNA